MPFEINKKDAELHFAILGERNLYCLVSKNFKNGEVKPMWLPRDKVIEFAQQMNNQECTVWISVNDKEIDEDSIEGTKVLRDFFVDVADKRKNKNVPATEEELKEAFNEAKKVFQFLERKFGATYFLAHSGNGWHIHFPLPYYPLTTKEIRVEVNRKLGIFYEEIRKQTGAEIDSTFDLRRCSTLIGSWNFKLPNHPLQTGWVGEFNVDDIEKARQQNKTLLDAILNMSLPNVEMEPSEMEKQQQRSHVSFEELLLQDEKLRDLFQNDFETVKNKYGYPTRSEAEQSLITKLVQHGFPDAEICEVMEKSNIGKWKERDDAYRTKSIEKARTFVATLKGKEDSLELLENEIGKSNRLEIHPLIDFHPEIGYSIGCFLGEDKIVQILGEKAIIADAKGNTVKTLSPKSLSGNENRIEQVRTETMESPTISFKKVTNKYISERWKESFLQIVKELYQGKEIEIKPRNDVFKSLLERIQYYYYHSDQRWHTFCACYVIGTYLHRIFKVFPHFVLQGVRRSGKTTLLLLLRQLVWNPTGLQSSLKSAALYRFIEDSRCTYLVDVSRFPFKETELSDLFECNEPESTVPRCVGETKEQIKFFHPFSPKVVAVRQAVPFKDKSIQIITETAKDKLYTERRNFIDSDPELKSLVNLIMRSVIVNWKLVNEAYLSIQQDDKLYGRRFELWRPFLAICKVYASEKYASLKELANEDMQESERGDIVSDVENAVLGILLSYPSTTESTVILQRDLTKKVQDRLGSAVVKSYHVVKSALENLKIIKQKRDTTDGVKYQIDLVKARIIAEERHVAKELGEKRKCDWCNKPIEGSSYAVISEGKYFLHNECMANLTNIGHTEQDIEEMLDKKTVKV
jgi:hypothetical protein